MGFPSPAQDYVEDPINLNRLFILHPSATFLVELGSMSYVVDASLKPQTGDEICYEILGEQGIGKLMRRAIITPDGEAIEGDILEEMVMRGVVILQVMKVWEQKRPF